MCWCVGVCVWVFVCIDVYLSNATERPWVSAPGTSVEAPYLHFNSPLLASKAVLSSWRLVVTRALNARGKFKPKLQFQADTSSYIPRTICTGVPGIGYVEVPGTY